MVHSEDGVKTSKSAKYTKSDDVISVSTVKSLTELKFAYNKHVLELENGIKTSKS